VNSLLDFRKTQYGRAMIWAQRAMTTPESMELLADADALLARPDCIVVKDQRKIKVARLIFPGGTPVYIKRYNAFSWRYRIQSWFSRSAAARSLSGAALLRDAGIKTAVPLAAVEVRRWGMLERSFYVSEEIVGAKTADAYWRENVKPLAGGSGFQARQRFLRGLGRLFQTLHQKRIYHNDLKDFNILVRVDAVGRDEFFILDLEGMRWCRRLSARRRIKNLVQLNRTLGRYLTRSEKLGFLKFYLDREAESPATLARWIERILAASRKAERISVAKHGRAQNTAHHNNVEKFSGHAH
jgi:hypothetical protein